MNLLTNSGFQFICIVQYNNMKKTCVKESSYSKSGCFPHLVKCGKGGRVSCDNDCPS